MSKVDSIQGAVFEAESPGYQEDFCAWSLEQARRLRLMRIPGLDIENVAEEIESLGRSDKRELHSRMAVLLTHLLKWCIQPSRAGRSWLSTIFVQRQRVVRLLEESPSLRPMVSGIAEREYEAARRQAMLETGLFEETFPAGCPWTEAQILDPDFLPANPADGD